MIEIISGRALHVVVDMQRLFAEKTDWHAPELVDILPPITRLAAARPAQTMFARFVVPPNASAATGRWRTYYQRWAAMTGDALPPGMLDLVEPLAALAADRSIFDKTTYSIFGSPWFAGRLRKDEIDTLILTGVETDICILASAFDAVDRGLRVVLPIDAVTSSSGDAHRAAISNILSRLPEQVDITTVDELLQVWL